MSRGVLYIVWGHRTLHDKTVELLDRSVASLKKFHPDMPVHVERVDASREMLNKDAMCDLSPFDTTLYLDMDTVVMGDLTFGFEQAEKHGLACCICENPWLKRYGSSNGDAVEYNTGVLFFDKAEKVTFAEWKELSPRTPDLVHEYGVMADNDQWSFARAVAQRPHPPFILPLNWNFRPGWQKSFFGPIKIWHDYSEPPESLKEWNAEQSTPGAIIRYAETINDA